MSKLEKIQEIFNTLQRDNETACLIITKEQEEDIKKILFSYITLKDAEEYMEKHFKYFLEDHTYEDGQVRKYYHKISHIKNTRDHFGETYDCYFEIRDLKHIADELENALRKKEEYETT